MNKKLKFFIAGMALVVGLASAVSCQDYSQDLDNLSNQISDLKSNVIAPLQQKIDDGKVITNVTSDSNGVTIKLSDGNSYTVKNGTNGTNGKNGTDGTDGHTPVIAIGDNGNWVIDGVDTGKASKGDKGDTSAIAIGENGNWTVDGVDTGVKAQGEDGKTPVIAIAENGNWTVDGVDTGVKAQGPKGDKGDSISWKIEDGMFVEYKNGEKTGNTETFAEAGLMYAVWTPETLSFFNVEGADAPVVINLLAALKSLAYVATYPYEKDQVGVGFYDESFGVVPMWMLRGRYPNGSLPVKFASNKPIISFRVNPVNANLKGAEFSYVDRLAMVTKATGDGDQEYVGNVVNKNLILGITPEDGELFSWIQVKHGSAANTYKDAKYAQRGDDTMIDKMHLVALKGVVAGDNGTEEIVSDFAMVEAYDMVKYHIYNKKWSNADSKTLRRNFYMRYDEETEEDRINNKWDENYAEIKKYLEVPEDLLLPNIEMPYYETINIFDYIETEGYRWVVDKWTDLPDIYAFDIDYKVKLVKSWDAISTEATDQQEFVEFNEETGELKVKDAYGVSAVNRTPLLKVQAWYEGLIIAEAYIKVKIVNSPAKPTIYPDGFSGKINYEKIVNTKFDNHNTGSVIASYSWKTFNQKVLNAPTVQLSYTQFKRQYDLDNVVIEYWHNGASTPVIDPQKPYFKNQTVPCVEAVANFETGPVDDVETSLFTIRVFDTIEENATGYVLFKIFPFDDHEYSPIVIKGEYTINHPNHSWTPLSEYYKIDENTVEVKGRMNGWHRRYQMYSELKEHFEGEFEGWTAPGNHSAITFSLPLVNNKPQAGAVINDGNDMYAASIELTDYLTADQVYTVRQTMDLDNGNVCTKDYFVKFAMPFVWTAPEIVLPTEKNPSYYGLFTVDGTDGIIFTENKQTNPAVVYNSKTISDEITATQLEYGGLTFKVEKIELIDELVEEHLDDARLTLSDFGVIKWDNHGAALQKEFKARYQVTYTVDSGIDPFVYPLCKFVVVGHITCLPTEK